MKNPQAKRYEELTYNEAISKQLKVMDAAAFSLCMESHIPIIVFDFFKKTAWSIFFTSAYQELKYVQEIRERSNE